MHAFSGAADQPWSVFREMVAAMVADQVWASGAMPATLFTACGRETNGGEGAREIFEQLHMAIGLWNGSQFVPGPSGAAYYSDYLEAQQAAQELGRPLTLRPLHPREQRKAEARGKRK